MRSRCIRFNFLAAILCAAIVGVTDCLVNNYLPTKNSIQQIHDGSSHETRRLPIVVVSKQHSQQKRKIHLYMSEDDSRENEIRRKVIIILSVILYIYCSDVPFYVCTPWLLEVNHGYMLINIKVRKSMNWHCV